jgi:hypothetical protein
VSNETCLNVSIVDDDVIVPVGSRLLVEEASGVHQLVNNQRHVNAALIQRHYLRPTRPPNVTVTPVVTQQHVKIKINIRICCCCDYTAEVTNNLWPVGCLI